MTSKQIQDAAKRAAFNLTMQTGKTDIEREMAIIASEFLPFAEDKPREPLEIKQTSVPLNKVDIQPNL